MKDGSCYPILQRHTIQIFIKQIRGYKYNHYNDDIMEILIPNIQTANRECSSEPSLSERIHNGWNIKMAPYAKYHEFDSISGLEVIKLFHAQLDLAWNLSCL